MFFFEEVNSKFFQTSKLNGFQIPHIFGRHVFVGIFFQSLSSRPSYRIALEKRETRPRSQSCRVPHWKERTSPLPRSETVEWLDFFGDIFKVDVFGVKKLWRENGGDVKLQNSW